MGSFDYIEVDGRLGQVKLFSSVMNTLRKGDEVDAFSNDKGMVINYSIAMREGGFVNVTGCRIESWTDEPKYKEFVLDKWGNFFKDEDEESTYLFDEE